LAASVHLLVGPAWVAKPKDVSQHSLEPAIAKPAQCGGGQRPVRPEAKERPQERERGGIIDATAVRSGRSDAGREKAKPLLLDCGSHRGHAKPRLAFKAAPQKRPGR